jgi:hypothetical protein
MIALIAATPRRITLELDPGDLPISGRLMANPGSGQPFTGWLSLLAALEAMVESGFEQAGEQQKEEQDAPHTE